MTAIVTLRYRGSTAYDRLRFPTPDGISDADHIQELRETIWDLFRQSERMYLVDDVSTVIAERSAIESIRIDLERGGRP